MAKNFLRDCPCNIQVALCLSWCINTLVTQKTVFFVPNQFQHQTENHSQQPSFPIYSRPDNNPSTEDQMSTQAAYTHTHSIPFIHSIAQPGAGYPVPSYTSVRYVVSASMPGSAPTEVVLFTKPNFGLLYDRLSSSVS